MPQTSLLKRQTRIAMRNRAIAMDYCPNCNIKLRDKWTGGMYCSKCGWEKSKKS